MRAPIIGICGPARSGKDTAAEFVLAAQGGYRYSFADPLRAMLKAGLGIDMNDPHWKQNKETPIFAFGNKSPRQMMQWLGTEWGRQLVDENLWITLAKNELMRRGPGMVIADVRFENEAGLVHGFGGKLIHLSRRTAPAVHAHASEGGVEIEPGDFVYANDSTLEDLQAFIEGVLKA